MRAAALAVVVLTCVATSRHAHAQDSATRASPPPRVDVGGPPLALSLDEAVRLALEHNADVIVTRLQRDSAREDIRAAEGLFDPRLQPSFSFEQATTPVTSAIGGAADGRLDQKNVAGALTLNGRSPWLGGRFSIDAAATRLETSNTFQRLNPQFPSSAAVQYVQPLWRGLRFDAERRQVQVARRNADLSEAQVTRIVMDQLLQVEIAYWDLAYARRNVEIQLEAVTQARRQVGSNERQVAQGTLAPIDVVEAATQVANLEQAVATAQQDLSEAEVRVKLLVASDPAAPVWDRPIDPQPLAAETRPPAEREASIAAALARRPELDEADATIERNAVDRRFFADQARPQVDLVGRYGLAGLAGNIVQQGSDPIGGGTVLPPFFAGGLNQSLANVLAWRFPVATLQLQVDLPFRNRTAEANVARNAIEGQQLARRRQQMEQAIAAEVRAALQAVESSRQRLASAGSAARNAQAQYESEQRRFESGLGTLFLVLERQTALVTAQARELRARADLNQAFAQLDRAVGTTLERHGVVR